ncbi:efflux transporter outer membrane subunit [Phenylobacterium sp.]|uniref:efflux transporter outer membrane subunit n=1 Tax=Phenylobacterium sp. TaxID=1871053 RepID=UPI002B91AB07|nr:efflux transporter outer membrane subunit [Phenylobacterium sp.]HLZ74775.1 efflux transporter outer membrane subunit [Phenylobacterium sp.]
MAALLAACATVPPTGKMVTPTAIASLDSQTSLAAAQTPWPADGWWRAYGDTQLDGLIEEALSRSPDLAAARARLAKADALAGQSRAALAPQVTAEGSLQAEKQSYNNGIPAAFIPHGYRDSARAALDFGLDLDLWGGKRAALAAAVGQAKAAEVDSQAARLTLSAAVAEAYGDLAQTEADLEAAREAQRIRRDTLTLIESRLGSRLENRGALLRAQSGVATATAQVAALDEAAALTRNRIAALMGEGPDRGLSIKRPEAASLRSFGLPADVRVALVGRRPDLAAARLRAEAAGQKIKAAKADFYPNIQLSAYFGLQSLGLGAFTKSGSDIGGIGPAVTLPIFDGGRLRAAYGAAGADYDSAVADYDQTLVQALREVADAAASSRALTQRLDESRKALDASRQAHDIALQRYRGGLSNYLDVLTAEDALITDQRAVADLQARAFLLDIALTRALGGGFKAA